MSRRNWLVPTVPSIPSYLIVYYSGENGVSLDVGFY